MTVTLRAHLDFVPEEKIAAIPLGGHLDGCRIGFDLGGSDRKCAAVVDGEVVHSEEVEWNPYFESDPRYHFDGIMDSLGRAAAHLPRVDAIGGSAAGVYVDSEPRVGSLFRGISEEDFEREIRLIFKKIRHEMNDVPFEVVNDGEVTALAASLAFDTSNILGIAMGTSLAAGYCDGDGRITGQLNELAFVPVDYRDDAPVDEWSGDVGCGVQYFSQQAVARLAPAAGLEHPDHIPFAERLVDIQSLMERGDERARRIYESIVISAPVQNEIWIIDHSTSTAEAAGSSGGRWGKGGDLLYRWGNPAAYRAGAANANQLHFQHDPQFVPLGYPGEGNVTVFDNRFVEGKRSAVHELVLPLDSLGNFILTPGSAYGPVAPIWTYTAFDLYSRIRSGAERLPNGNTLISSALQSWIFEVTPAGQRVWEHNSPGQMFHAHHTRRSLWADVTSMTAAVGGRVNFDLLEGTPAAGDTYLLLCSAAGTTPGTTLFGVNIPLNLDPFFQASATYPNAAPIFTQTFGTLGALGEAAAAFTLPAGLPGGYQLDFAFIQFQPLLLKSASNPVPIQVL